MAISVTTRSGKGSELTTAEMDNNLTSLARSASTTQEGNIRVATQAEVNAGSSQTLAVTPAFLTARVNELAGDAIGDGTTSASLTTSGSWTDSVSGLQVKWGNTSSVSGDGTLSVNYPSSFDNGTLCVVASAYEDTPAGGTSGPSVGTKTWTASGFVVTNDNKASRVSWIAIGY